MKNQKPILLTRKSLVEIEEIGRRAFAFMESDGGLDPTELKTLLVIKGLEGYLKKYQIEVPFVISVNTNRHKDKDYEGSIV